MAYTLEASFCGGFLGNSGKGQFNVKTLMAVGKNLCYTMIDYFKLRPEVLQLRRHFAQRKEEYQSNHQVLSPVVVISPYELDLV